MNIVNSIIGGQWWHSIWQIRWSPTRYWRSLKLMCCVMWRSVWLLANQGKPSWINDWIIKWKRHRYHRWFQLIYIWVTVLAIKALVITWSVLWRSGWLLTNRGQLNWIDDRIFQWRRQRYHRWWQLVAIWVNVLPIKAQFITRGRSLPTMIFSCSTFLATTNTLWKWNYECSILFWWSCVPVILFVDVHQKVRSKF